MLDLAQGADLRAIVFDERIMRLTVKAKRRIVGELFSTKKEFYAYIVQCLADYADLMFRNLPEAAMFATHNEPVATYVVYALKGFAPGFGLEKYGRQANHNLLLSHGKAVQAFRASGNKAKIGIVVDIWNRVPADPQNEDDVNYAAEQNGLAHGSYLSPIFLKKYDPYVVRHLEKENIVLEMRAEDLDIIAQPLDFYGLNCYNRLIVSRRDVDIRKIVLQSGGNFLENGAEFYPDAIYEALRVAKTEYGIGIPVYITENGVGFAQEREENGMIRDTERIKYLKGSLASVRRALKEGYDVRGYFLWSLMDNFEWTAGYSMKYGICTRDRKMKESALFYRDWIREQKKAEAEKCLSMFTMRRHG